eukprot:scaffold7340_cov266-Pinguiococcus_pyrenoidosus.AAC.30
MLALPCPQRPAGLGAARASGEASCVGVRERPGGQPQAPDCARAERRGGASAERRQEHCIREDVRQEPPARHHS